jgi:predicted ATPase
MVVILKDKYKLSPCLPSSACSRLSDLLASSTCIKNMEKFGSSTTQLIGTKEGKAIPEKSLAENAFGQIFKWIWLFPRKEPPPPEPKRKIKVVIVGEVGVGKTSLMKSVFLTRYLTS